MTDLRQAAQQVLEPSDFQKWSVLAFRALDDAGRVLMTIEPESTTEGERLDQLKETIRELLTQVLLLNGVWTRRQLDERFQFGKLDTDALNVQLGQQQAALKQQAEPTCPECKAAVLYECVACSSNNYPPKQQAEPVPRWDKPSTSFNEWWDSYRHNPANPFAEGSAAYWAWAGWQAAKRPWVGLTDEDFLEACQIAERGNYLLALQRIQIKLKERNT